jgi:hypothetical protein
MSKKPKPVKKITKKQQEENFKSIITTLNNIVCVRIAPSPIHGVGVFATQDLKKGDTLNLDASYQIYDLPYSRFDELLPEVRDLLLGMFPLIIDGSKFIYPVTRMTAFLNHSDTPNYDAKNDKVLVDIPKGTELTEDYRLIPNYEKIFNFIK